MNRRKFSKTIGLVAAAAVVPQFILAKEAEYRLPQEFQSLPIEVQKDINKFAIDLSKQLKKQIGQNNLIKNYLAPTGEFNLDELEAGYSCQFQNINGTKFLFTSMNGHKTTHISS